MTDYTRPAPGAQTVNSAQRLENLLRDGGYTVSAQRDENGQYVDFHGRDGFGVSLPGFEVKVPAALMALKPYGGVFLQNDILEALADIVRSFHGTGHFWLGAWRDGDDIYFDITEIVQSCGQALALGRERGQRAIWDFEHACAIEVSPPFTAS